MGSWNATCAVTQLPICYRDRVRIMLLAVEEHRADYTGNCYPCEDAFPVTPAMPGVYDDYGGAKLDEPLDPAAKFALTSLKIAEDEEDLVTLLRSDGAPVFSRWGAERLPLGIWMVHEEVYQHLMNAIVLGENSWRPGPTHAQLREMADELSVRFAAFSVEAENGDNDTLLSLFGKVNRYRRPGLHGNPNHHQHTLLSLLEGYPVNFRSGLQTLSIHMESLATTGPATPVEAFRPFAYAIADAIRLNDAMTILRRSYAIQSGAGSQSVEYAAHISMAQFTADLGRRWMRAYEEGEDEVEDEVED